jgi:hypothetical protein
VDSELLLVPNKSKVKHLVRLLLVVAVDHDGDGFRHLAGGEGHVAVFPT